METLEYFPVYMSQENVSHHSSQKHLYLTRILTAIIIIILFSLIELTQVTGIAAILRFPMPELEDEGSESEEERA
jgi:hypothetical protein